MIKPKNKQKIEFWKPEKKLPKKPNREKKPIKPIRILKKSTGSVRFYKPKTEKTKPNLNQAKPEKNQTKPKNQAKLVWTGFCSKKLNQTETGFGSVFLKKI